MKSSKDALRPYASTEKPPASGYDTFKGAFPRATTLGVTKKSPTTSRPSGSRSLRGRR